MQSGKNFDPVCKKAVHCLFVNCLLALGYFLGGFLGHLLETQPANVSPIWPAAGVALAGVLVYGKKVVPGIFFGALFTQIYVFLDWDNDGKLWAAIGIGAGIGLGSVLQAWVGGFLTERWVGKRSPLITGHSITRFLLLAGPVSCLISPTVATSVLFVNHVISLDDCWFTWLMWWVGDVIGVIVVTPLIFLPLTQPPTARLLRRRFVVYPLLGLLFVVVAVFEYGKQAELLRLKAAFDAQVNLFHAEMRWRLGQIKETNRALKAFFDSSEHVTPFEFQEFAVALMQTSPHVQALEWTPRVTDHDRQQWEAKRHLLIRQYDASGALKESGHRPYYFPIRHVEPLAGNEKALGFDIGSNPDVRPIIDQAIRRGVAVATKGIRLVQDDQKNNFGIVLYSPVYQKGQKLDSEDLRERAFEGFAATVFRVADQAQDILQAFPQLQLFVVIKDKRQQKPLFDNVPKNNDAVPNYGLQPLARELRFGGGVWEVKYRPSLEFYANSQSWAMWWLLFGGFFLCALTSSGLLLITGNTLSVEQLVEARTRALHESNRHLTAAVDQHEHMLLQQKMSAQVMELLATNQPLQAILDAVTKNCEALYAGHYCSIMLLDDTGQYLSDGSAPSLPDFYLQAIKKVPMAYGVGSCGTALASRQLVIVEDILNHPFWHGFLDLMVKTPYRACWSQPILAADGRALGTFGNYHTEVYTPQEEELQFVQEMAHLVAVAIEQKERESGLLIAATTFESHDGIFVTDHNAIILKANKAFTAITGYSEEEVIGKNPKILSSGMHGTDFYRQLYRKLKKNGQWEGEIWNRSKGGRVFPEWLKLTVVKGQQGETIYYVAIFSDISNLKAAEKEIHALAYYDPLTALPNRRLLLDRLQHEIELAKQNHAYGSVLFLDLDRFKTLNDSLGHHVGDELLKQVAERLRTVVDSQDTVCRLGGDEFIVLTHAKSNSLQEVVVNTEELAKKILACINRAFVVFDNQRHFTTSIGVTLYPELHESPEAIIQQADTAMYWAKESGRNAVSFFKPSMQEYADNRLTLEQALRQALQENQLQMHYQSQIDHEGKVLSAEALIRWHHEEKGIIPTGEFIALAEESELILLIGDWVLDEVCRHINVWDAQGRVIDHVAINVSSKQFRQVDFVDKFGAALQNTGVAGERLMIELTEGSVIEDMDDTIAKMQRLKAMGVGISIDDFGIGYSSLLYLKKLPLNQLKIDQSFVHEVDSNPSDAVIVETIIHMAKNLGLSVIAEGVENERQLTFLLDRGCLMYQGYYFAKPVPVGRFWHAEDERPKLMFA